MRTTLSVLLIIIFATSLYAQQPTVTQAKLGPYEYETKPDHEAFKAFNPRKAPATGDLLLRHGDRLAICGDSITQQKKYSRIIETYLTVCAPELEISVRQYGWSGEKTDGFLRRMDKDCLTFKPTVATLAYGMNDSRYRPFDVTNGQWFADHLSEIVRRFKENDVRVVVGSPPCAGKIAGWVKSRSGTLQQHNIHLCALRDIGIGVAESQQVRYADIFWPMFQAQVFAPGQHGATEQNPYEVAGEDGIHPDWAGQVIMAWAFLKTLGLDGNIGKISIDLESNKATASDGHEVISFRAGELKLKSTRYPFCSSGDPNSDSTVRSGMTLVPFAQDLNRLVLAAKVPDGKKYAVRWGDETQVFTSQDLSKGVNLAAEFATTPFDSAFERVDQAVAAKQAYETNQIKKEFHSREAKKDFEAVVTRTEAERKPLADAILQSRTTVQHSIQITLVP